MKKINKLMLIPVMVLSCVGSVIAIELSNKATRFMQVQGTDPYKLVFDGTHNVADPDDWGELHVTTTAGNDVQFEISTPDQFSNEYWGKYLAHDHSIFTMKAISEIRNIESIVIDFNNTASVNTFAIYFGIGSPYGGTYVVTTVEKHFEFNFDNEKPSYFEVIMANDEIVDTTINYININYDCENVQASVPSYYLNQTFSYLQFIDIAANDTVTRRNSVSGWNSNFREYDDIDKEHVTVPTTFKGYDVTEIFDRALMGTEYFKSITFEDVSKITRIGESAFYNCYNLNCSFAFSGNLKEIGEDAFRNTSVPSVVLAEGTERIGQDAFSASNISQFNLPASVTTIDGPFIRYNPYLATLTVESDNPVFTDGGKNVVMYKNKSGGYYHVIAGANHCQIPSGAYLETEVLSGMYTGSYLDISYTVDSSNPAAYLARDCFAWCDWIKVANLKSVAYIGSSAFYRCENLEVLYIDKNCVLESWVAFEYIMNAKVYTNAASFSEFNNYDMRVALQGLSTEGSFSGYSWTFEFGYSDLPSSEIPTA